MSGIIRSDVFLHLILGISCGYIFNIAQLKCFQWENILCNVWVAGKNVTVSFKKRRNTEKGRCKWSLLCNNTEVWSLSESQMGKYRFGCTGSTSQSREWNLDLIMFKQFMKRWGEKVKCLLSPCLLRGVISLNLPRVCIGYRAENSLYPLLFIPGSHFQCQATFK